MTLYSAATLNFHASSQCATLMFSVCGGLTSFLNIWGHITMVPSHSSGTLTNVLQHRNDMPQTQDTKPHSVTVYRRADLWLCYPLIKRVTHEVATTHFNDPTNLHTKLTPMLWCWHTVRSSVKSRPWCNIHLSPVALTHGRKSQKVFDLHLCKCSNTFN